MNSLSYLIAGLLIGIFLIETLARVLNIGRLNSSLPGRFSHLYDQEKYARMQRYNRESSWLSLVESTVGLAVLLVFWFMGGFGMIQRWAEAASASPVISGLIFVAILWFASYLLQLPFDIYDTFVLEQKFGFNRTGPGLFVADQIRSILLTLVLGGLLVAAIIALFAYTGDAAWIYCWIVVTVFTLVMLYLGPALLMPLFNDFKPLENGELKERVMEYARKSSFPLSDVEVMDGSRRSAHANAFFTGIGGNKKIVLFDTLISRHSVDELVAVLAHEVGHFKLRHIIQRIVASILVSAVFLYFAAYAIKQPVLFEAFGMTPAPIAMGLVAFMIATRPIVWLFSLVSSWISRRHEFEADQFARQTTGDAAPLVTALETLTKDNLSNLNPHPLYVFLNYSHPTLLERVTRLNSANPLY